MVTARKGWKRATRRAAQWAAPKALRALQLLISRAKPGKAEELGERLGRLWWAVSKRRRQRAIKNLALAFPEQSEAERTELARRTFLHFGRVVADFLARSSDSPEQLNASTEVAGREILDAALSQGKGVMMLTGHFGNWERAARWLAQNGYSVSVVARDADQSDVNDMVNAMRKGPGTEVIARGNAARPVIERLRAGEVVAIVPDQNAKEAFIPFFGHPTGTVLGPGVLAERTGCIVLPAACLWVGPGEYRFEIGEPLEAVAGEGFARGEGMMRAFSAFLEGAIRRHPEQYLWVHDRWRFARKLGHLPSDS